MTGTVLLSFPTRKAAEQALVKFNELNPDCHFGFGRLRLSHDVTVRLIVHQQIFLAMRDVISRTALALQEQLKCEVSRHDHHRFETLSLALVRFQLISNHVSLMGRFAFQPLKWCCSSSSSKLV